MRTTTMTGTAAKPRLPLAAAEALAREVAALLAPVCLQVEVAGSIRRQRATIGDVELLVAPCVAPGPPDLFGEPQGEVNALDEQVGRLLADGTFTLRPGLDGKTACGSRYKRLAYQGVAVQGVAVDCFAVLPPAQWGCLLTIRTGSATFSHRLVTPRLLGGWLPTGLRVRDGALHEGERLIETPTEESFFEACGLPWLAPPRRTDTVQVWAARDGKQWIDRQARLREAGQ